MQPGEGKGDFPVTMMLYTDSTYQEVYNEPPTLNVTDRSVTVNLIYFEKKKSLSKKISLEIFLASLYYLKTKSKINIFSVLREGC